MTLDEMQEHTQDEKHGERLTDHQYDGIQEYDNPLPRWWVWVFYATIAFSILYVLNVPGIGTGRGRIANYEREMAAARARQQAMAAEQPRLEDTDASLAAAVHDPAVLALGKEVFTGTCGACHRADGGGNIGPNLTDDYWIHGGRPTEILHTVEAGVLEKGMPAWSQTLPLPKVRAAAVYVLTLHDSHPDQPKPPQGVKVEDDGNTAEHAGGTAEHTGSSSHP